MKKQIPNFFTFLNMFCGLIALIFSFYDRMEWSAFFVFLGIFFDFFDGFFARLFDVQTDLGLQLDSLADMVTSGVVPGMIIFKMLEKNYLVLNENGDLGPAFYLPFTGFIITMAAGFRLAKFNLDNRQSDSFIGVPTPAMSMFVVSLPLIGTNGKFLVISDLIQSSVFLFSIILVFSYLMNSNLPLFAMKFKSFDWKSNWVKYSFLILSLVLVIFFHIVAIPIVIFLYLLISIISHNVKKKRLLNLNNSF